MFFRRFTFRQTSSDQELILRYRQTADLQVLGDLYHRYLHLVYGVCLKYLRDEEESKDASMQVFEKLIVELKEHEVSNFKSWLYTLSRNHCLMQLRARKLRNGHDVTRLSVMEDLDFNRVDYPQNEDLEENLVRMEKGMVELPPEQRRCLQLFYIEQKSYKEITDLTGFDFKQVKSYLQNGKRNLKIYLEKQNG
jgi:RNA polymerase sigma-70 factor (ECF subfamily)